LPYLPSVSLDRLKDALRRTMPGPAFFEVSAVTGTGIEQWQAWLGVRSRALTVDASD
jgi:hypothetical protein